MEKLFSGHKICNYHFSLLCTTTKGEEDIEDILYSVHILLVQENTRLILHGKSQASVQLFWNYKKDSNREYTRFFAEKLGFCVMNKNV